MGRFVFEVDYITYLIKTVDNGKFSMVSLLPLIS